MRPPCQPPGRLSLLAPSLATHSSVTMASEALYCECLGAPINAKANYLVLPDLRLMLCRWHNRRDWDALIRNGMTSDLSWDRAAKDYEQIFSWALMDPPQA